MRKRRTLVILFAAATFALTACFVPAILRYFEDGRLLEKLRDREDVEAQRAAADELSQRRVESAVPILLEETRWWAASIDRPDVTEFYSISSTLYASREQKLATERSQARERIERNWSNNWPGKALARYGPRTFERVATRLRELRRTLASGKADGRPSSALVSEIQALFRTAMHFDPKVWVMVVAESDSAAARACALQCLSYLDELDEESIDRLASAPPSADPEVSRRWVQLVGHGPQPLARRFAGLLIRIHSQAEELELSGEILTRDVLEALARIERPDKHVFDFAKQFEASEDTSVREAVREISMRHRGERYRAPWERDLDKMIKELEIEELLRETEAKSRSRGARSP